MAVVAGVPSVPSPACWARGPVPVSIQEVSERRVGLIWHFLPHPSQGLSWHQEHCFSIPELGACRGGWAPKEFVSLPSSALFIRRL